MRVNTVLYRELIDKIDAAAREQGLSRSGFIREASERYLTELERKKAEEMKRKKRDRAVKLQDELRAKGGDWNGAGEVRRGRDRG